MSPVEGDNLSASGQIGWFDIDQNDTFSVQANLVSFNNSSTLIGHPLNAEVGLLQFGTLDTVNRELPYTFTVSDSDIDSLASGETLTQVYRITLTDSANASATQDVTVQIHGTNDAPVLSVANLTVFEDGTPASITASKSDSDASDTHSFSITRDPSAGSANIDSNGEVSFDPGSDFQSLAAGEQQVVTFDVAVADSQGATDTKTVSVTVTGVNDDPSFNSGIITGSLTEIAENDQTRNEGEFLTTQGSLAFLDVDLSDTHTATLVGAPTFVKSNPEIPLNNALGQLTLSGVDQTAHRVLWSFEVSDADLDILEPGETLTQTYSIKVADGEGGTDTQSISLVLTGTNDAPVLTVADLIVTEDSNPIGDMVEASDVDHEAEITFAVTQPSAGVVSIDENTGAYSFDTDGQFEYLAHGETETVSFTVTATDQHGEAGSARVQVTIRGVDDAPSVVVGEYTQAEPQLYVENANPVRVFSSAGVSVVEQAHRITTLKMNVAGVVDVDQNTGESIETINWFGQTLPLEAGNYDFGEQRRLVIVENSNGTLELTLTSVQGITANLMAQELRDLAYANTSEMPIEGQRIFRIISVEDSGTTNSADDQVPYSWVGSKERNLNLVSYVNVRSVNDAPEVTNLGTQAQRTFEHRVGGTASDVAMSPRISDIEIEIIDRDYQGTTLRVERDFRASADDQFFLNLPNGWIMDDENRLWNHGVQVAEFSQLIGSAEVVFTAAGTSVQQIEQLAAAWQYKARVGAQTGLFKMNLSIGDGNTDNHQGWGGQKWGFAEFWIQIELASAVEEQEVKPVHKQPAFEEKLAALPPRQLEREKPTQSPEKSTSTLSPISYSNQTLNGSSMENAAQINLLKSGLINVSESILDLYVSKVEVDRSKTVLSLFDKLPGRIYYAELLDGTRLPDGISIDPITGEIVIVDELRNVNFGIRVTAYDVNGKVEILEINTTAQGSVDYVENEEKPDESDDAASVSNFNKRLSDEALREESHATEILKIFNQISSAVN
jgi:VCBS repeat-containing protein